jgi:hypothetical protein
MPQAAMFFLGIISAIVLAIIGIQIGIRKI